MANELSTVPEQNHRSILEILNADSPEELIGLLRKHLSSLGFQDFSLIKLQTAVQNNNRLEITSTLPKRMLDHYYANEYHLYDLLIQYSKNQSIPSFYSEMFEQYFSSPIVTNFGKINSEIRLFYQTQGISEIYALPLGKTPGRLVLFLYHRSPLPTTRKNKPQYSISDMRPQQPMHGVHLVKKGSDNRSLSIGRCDCGCFHLIALVNGLPIDFVLDTGSTDIVMSCADARRVGIDVTNIDFCVPSGSAGGEIRLAPVTLESLTYCEINLKNLRATVAQELTQSVLGQSFISQIDGIEISGETMTLRL